MKGIIILCCLFFSIFTSVKGQNYFSPSLQFTDSLQGSDSTFLVQTALRVNFSNPIFSSYSIQLRSPEGWRLLGSNKLTIRGNSDSIFRITFLRSRFAQAKWSPVKLQLFDSLNQMCLDTFFLIKAPWRLDFQLFSTDSIVEISDTSRFALMTLRIINKGSVEGSYAIYVKKSAEVISTFRIASVLPGSDTLIHIPILVPPGREESQIRLQVHVVDSFSQSRTFPFSIVRRFSNVKVNPTPFGFQKLTLETGFFLLEKRIYHFHETRTTFNLKKGDLNFSFRTKTFGQQLSVERNIFTADYSGKRLRVLMGQLSDNTHFFSYGRGVSIQFNPVAKQEWGGKLILRNDQTIYTNNNIQLYSRHQQGAIHFLHQLVVDLDRIRGSTSYLINHEVSLHKSERFKIKSIFAAGIEEFKRLRVFHSGDLGIGVGLASFFKLPKWELAGDLLYYQKSFPGLNKGLRNYQIDLRRIFKNISVGLFYRYNYVSVPILYDSVYIMDAFKFNMERLGFRTSFSSSTYHISFSSGQFRQVGLAAGQLDQYIFIDNNISWQLNKKTRLQFSTLSGFAGRRIVSEPVWFSNSSVDIKWKRMGVKGFYVRQPIFRDSAVKVLVRTIETVLLSPYCSFKVFNRVPISLRYTLSKSIYDKFITQGFGFTLQYKSTDNNWQIQCNGTVPLTATIPNQTVLASFPYVTLSIQKTINVPTFFKRRYFNLRVIVYEDENANGLYDMGEPCLDGVRFAVNSLRFLTDAAGSFTISNTASGKYNLIAESGYSQKGLTPVLANVTIDLKGSQTYYFSFRKGHAIGGFVKFDLDPYSKNQITPENIMIKFVDQLGKKYTTLTDTAGKFLLNVPAGIYTVSLNETSFTGSIRPVVGSFQVNLQNSSYESIIFELRERRRPIRYRDH